MCHTKGILNSERRRNIRRLAISLSDQTHDKKRRRRESGHRKFYEESFSMQVISVRKQLFLFFAVFVTFLFWGFSVRKDFTRLASSSSPNVSSWTDRDIIGRHQDDPSLIAYIKNQLHLPSDQPYNLLYGAVEDYSQFNQTGTLKKIFGEKKNGFFIEAGAYDGEQFSNTLYWERQHSWTGLLIEPDPENFAKLLKRNRKAYCLRACLCPTDVANMTTFFMSRSLGAMVEGEGFPSNARQIQVPCYPLYSILAAVGFPSVDFLSLDVEGWELKILRSIPFELTDIKLILVEFNHLKEGFDELERLMESNGYVNEGKLVVDGVFVKKKKEK